MLQTLKLISKKWKNSSFPKKKSLVGSTPGFMTHVEYQLKKTNIKSTYNVILNYY